MSLQSLASSMVGMGLKVQPMMDCLIRPFLMRKGFLLLAACACAPAVANAPAAARDLRAFLLERELLALFIMDFDGRRIVKSEKVVGKGFMV